MPEDVWILCPDEGSPRRALELAGELARGGRLTVLRVAPPWRDGGPAEELADELLGPDPRGCDGVAGVPTETVVLEDAPAVRDAVREGRPDVVVAPLRRPGPLAWLRGDDPARQLLRDATCPVVLVPEEPPPRP